MPPGHGCEYKIQTWGICVKRGVNDMNVKNIHGLTTISLLAPQHVITRV